MCHRRCFAQSADSNGGGTFVDEVSINREHCWRGFLGITDCRDTGESVTMRIVANINEGNPAVPFGGQKGSFRCIR